MYFQHGHMAMGGYGLHKVSPGPALPYPCKPCGQAIPKTVLEPISGVARPLGRPLAAMFYPFGHPTPYAYDFQ
jgi:hypothetical protein